MRILALLPLAVFAVACSGDVIGELPSPPTPAITASPTPELENGVLAEIAVDGSPCFVAEAGGRVWVTAFDGNELIEIDPESNEVIDTFRMPGGPCGMVERDGELWIETPNANRLVVFDPRRGRVIDRMQVPGGVFGLQSTPTGLWGVAGQGQVVQIDPESRTIVGRVNIEGPLGGLAVEGDQIWTVTGRNAIVRIDPRTHEIADQIVPDSFEPEGLTIGKNYLWVSSSFEGNILRVDLDTKKERDRLPVGDSLFGGVVIGDTYWVAGNNTIYEVDADSGEVLGEHDNIGFGPFPAAGNLWTVDFLSNTVFRLDEPAN